MNDAVTALVVGLGSIGQRHVQLLRDAGVRTQTVSRRPGADFTSLNDALLARPELDLVIIATETSMHASAIVALDQQGFAGTTLVEKPVVSSPNDRGHVDRDRTFVGYNLRFHPAMAALRSFASTNDVISIEIHAGQDLRTWRTDRDLQSSYSASAEQGGGVLRDLSHELDYLLWIAGPWKRVVARGGLMSTLPIGSDDLWHVLLETQNGQLCSIVINYLDAPARRTIHLSGVQGSCTADLVTGTVTTASEVVVFDAPRDLTYQLMHEALLLGQPDDRLCAFDEGLQVVELIAAIERSQQEDSWINR